jgi:hypothetical protein
MLRSQGSLMFNQPIEEVFAFLARPEQSAGMLQYGEARVISEGPVRAGTRIHHTGKGVLRWLKSAAEITTYDPPYHLATREEASGCMGGTATYRFELEPAEQGTNVTLIMEGAYKGWARVFFLLFSQSQLMKDQMSRSAQIRLSQLKNRLEASASPGKASLPDLSARLAEQEQAGFETFSTQTTTKQYRLSSMLIRMQPRDLVSLPGESTRRHLFFLTPFLLAALALFGFALKDFWGTGKTPNGTTFPSINSASSSWASSGYG